MVLKMKLLHSVFFSIILGNIAQCLGLTWQQDLCKDLTQNGIKEGTDIGRDIGFIQAQDSQQVTYGTSSTSLAVVESSGRVQLGREIDRETTKSINVTFTASDSDGNQISSSCTVQVLDVNDEMPVFNQLPYSARVAENTKVGDTVFDLISVTDADIGNNARIKLSCYVPSQNTMASLACQKFEVSQEMISPGNYRGKINLRETLDFEKATNYVLILRAVDEGVPPKTSQVNVEIQVQDVQDSPPTFLTSQLSLSVLENTKPDTSLQPPIQVRDQDTGVPRPLLIKIISDPKKLFKLGVPVVDIVQQNLYVVNLETQGNIDREVIGDSYTIEVQAIELNQDNLETSVSATLPVTISILDANDNPPMFNQQQYIIPVQEELLAGTDLPGLSMVITDTDVGDHAYYEMTIQDDPRKQMPVPMSSIYSVAPISGTGTISVVLIVQNQAYTNYEIPEYRTQYLQIVAKETRTVQAFSSTATVMITLTDKNDNLPQFGSNQYAAAVRENEPVESLITTITATDADSGVYGDVTYSLSGTGSDKFAVNNKTGEVTLAKTLDFESQNVYNFQYQATDGGGRTQIIPFRVNILDYNDEGPVFQRTEYRAIVLETGVALLPQLKVLAIDADTDFPVTYSIIGGNTPDNAFYIDPNTGVISVIRPLDVNETPNKQGFFELLIEASDNGLIPQSSTVIAIITIRDVNDHPPEFGSAIYYGTVPEIVQQGRSVVTVSATDMDMGENADIKYILYQGSKDNFVIDENTGVISTAVTDLNIERFSNKYDIKVYAVDGGSPQRTGTAQVIITVTDSNNQVPTFSQSAYVFTVPETADVGSVVDTLRARDPDSTASIVYSIRPGSITAKDKSGNPVTSTVPFNYMTAFIINPNNGAITTTASLNRNQVAQVTFIVDANDTSAEFPRPQIGSATIQINIISTTDGGIKFPPPWSPENHEIVIPLPEDTPEKHSFYQVTATDPQTGNQITDYRKVEGSDPGNYFTVEKDTGNIRTNKILDYEKLPSNILTFQIQAFSPPPDSQSAVATIKVIVEDINDNNPRFVEDEYSYSIPENLMYPSPLEPPVKAEDADSGNFSKITYSLSGQNSDLFSIDPITGVVTVAPNVTLDREGIAVYIFQVQATDNVDGEGGQRKTWVPMVITLEDINDNVPKFLQPVYNMNTLETVGADTSLGQVIARDDDLGLNGQVDYSIKSGNDQGLFYIETQKGIIRSRVNLNGYAQQLPYQLIVLAKDPTSNPNEAEVVVNIYVNDLQSSDGKPRVISPTEDEVFPLNEDSGINTTVTQINATDPNPKPGSKITYGFLVNEAINADSSKFNIDPNTGLITLKENLDYETKTTLELIIVIKTNSIPPREVQRRIYINVTDANDNTPSFKCPGKEYVNPVTASVMENEPAGVIVTQILACDADGPEFSTIYYFITCGNEPDNERFNGSRPFYINKMTGIVYTGVSLDREHKASYEICVEASNFPELNTTAVGRKKRQVESDNTIRVSITVTDVDDNGPSFAGLRQESFIAGILATARFGTSVTEIQASDSDTNPDYTKVTYTLEDEMFVPIDKVSQDTPLAFMIDTVTGIVVTNLNSYIPYIDGYFLMKVVATDKNQNVAKHDLFIYVVREFQRLRFIFNSKPNEVNGFYPYFLSQVRPKFLPTYQINSDSMHYSILEEGRVDFEKTDVCFHMVRDNHVVNADTALDVMRDKEANDQTLVDLYNTYTVQGVDVCEVKTTTKFWSGYWWLWWLLIALALFIFIVCLIMICCICYFWPRYKRNYRREKPYVILDPPVSLPDYEWREEIVKMD